MATSRRQRSGTKKQPPQAIAGKRVPARRTAAKSKKPRSARAAEIADAHARLAEAVDRVVNGPTTMAAMNEVVIPTLAPVGRATGALVGRLVTIGDSLLAHAQRGIVNLVDLIRQAVQRVPQERLREPPVEQLVPLLEAAKHQIPGTPLWDMFAELLAKTFDAEAHRVVHPAFAGLVAQMSPDEARLVLWVHDNEGVFFEHKRESSKSGQVIVGGVTVPKERRGMLLAPELISALASHLVTLGVLEPFIPGPDEHGAVTTLPGGNTVELLNKYLGLSVFGRLFATAVLPPRVASTTRS